MKDLPARFLSPKTIPMKTKKFRKILLFSFLGILFSFGACKKDTKEPPLSDELLQGTTYWECNLVKAGPDTVNYFYFFTLVRTGNQVEGEVAVRDSNMLATGVISGTVDHDSLFLTADFQKNGLDFTFRGLLYIETSQAVMGGSVHTEWLPATGNDEETLVVVPSENFHCPDVFPDNPYVFRKVSSSEHPGDSAVIFIHGMTGDLTHWDAVISRLTPAFKKRHDVYVFQYNWKDSIRINGRVLFDSVQAAGLTNPVIVAHSMGGLVARAYIARGGNVATLVALGTPHLGSPLATLTKLLCFINFPGPKDMAPESPFITSLLANPNDVQSRGRYVVFAGQMKGSFKFVKGRLRWVWAEDYYDIMDKVGYDAFVLFGSPSNDGLVPLSSGLFEGYPVKERKPVLEWVDHKNLRNPAVSVAVMEYINNL